MEKRLIEIMTKLSIDFSKDGSSIVYHIREDDIPKIAEHLHYAFFHSAKDYKKDN